MLEASLVRLGFKDKEVSVFLGLLELGAQPASVVAKRAGLNRATTYVILDGLVSQGLVSRVEKSGIQTFAAISPEELLEVIRMRKRELEEQEFELKNVIPQLQAMASQYLSKPKVRYYEGIEGIKAVMEETLTSKESLRVYANMDAWKNSPLSEYIKTYCHRRSFEAKIPLRALIYDTPYAHSHFAVDHCMFEVHFIPKEVVFDQNFISIFENKLVMVSLVAGMMYGIVIESQEIAATQKAIFELAWMGCDPECLAIRR